MSNLVQSPFPMFADADGSPLENGYIYIGTAGLNPISNPLQAYWNADLTVPAYNIRTSGGYPSYNGSPGRLYTEDSYSILVKNSNGVLIYSHLNSVDYSTVASSSYITSVNTLADLRLIIPEEDAGYVQVSVGGSVTIGDGLMGPLYYWDQYSDDDDDGVSIIKPTDEDSYGRWKWINNVAPTDSVELDSTDIDADDGLHDYSAIAGYSPKEHDYTYYSSAWYRSLAASTGEQPDTATTYWVQMYPITLDLESKNRIFLVDTDTNDLTLIVPDGDFQGQNISLSNIGTNNLCILAEGIFSGYLITGVTTLKWTNASWVFISKDLPKGYSKITLSEYDTDAEPAINTGSGFETLGDAITISADITPTGYADITDETAFYLYYDYSEEEFIYSETAPTWSDSLQDWYSGNDKALFSMYKDSTGLLYERKEILIPKPLPQIRMKTFEIGSWDMDADATIIVDLSIEGSKWRGVAVVINHDTAGTVWPLFEGTSVLPSGNGYWDNNTGSSTSIRLSRIASGNFDSTSFNDTTINRGYITLTYEV